MSKLEKLVQKAKTNPKELRPQEVEKIYESGGWTKRSRKHRKGSSHEVYVGPDNKEKTVPKKKKVNRLYVKEMIANLGFEEG